MCKKTRRKNSLQSKFLTASTQNIKQTFPMQNREEQETEQLYFGEHEKKIVLTCIKKMKNFFHSNEFENENFVVFFNSMASFCAKTTEKLSFCS